MQTIHSIDYLPYLSKWKENESTKKDLQDKGSSIGKQEWQVRLERHSEDYGQFIFGWYGQPCHDG